MAKKKKKDDLDMETTIADMNVEGFRSYNPHKEKGTYNGVGKITRKEYWAMVRGAFAAMLPLFGILLAVGAIIVLLAILWLK
jgi:hypothetical protein